MMMACTTYDQRASFRVLRDQTNGPRTKTGWAFYHMYGIKRYCCLLP